MKIILTLQEVMKIIGTLSLEEINSHREYNWHSWKVSQGTSDCSTEFELIQEFKENSESAGVGK